MTTDLKYLAFTAMLTSALWIPYVVAQVTTNGSLKPGNYGAPRQRPLQTWGRRAGRVYLNAVETFAPFAVLVILIQLTGKANATTAYLTMAFFWLLGLHAIVYWPAIPYIRTIVFTLGFVVVIGLFVELMM